MCIRDRLYTEGLEALEDLTLHQSDLEQTLKDAGMRTGHRARFWRHHRRWAGCASTSESRLGEGTGTGDTCDEAERGYVSLEDIPGLAHSDSHLLPPRATYDTIHTVESQLTAAVSTGLDAQTRLARLTTELANERTLLAWIRTVCSVFGLSLKLLSLDDAYVAVAGFLLELGMLCVFVVGVQHYNQVKKALLLEITPKHFGRIGNTYLIGGFGVLVVIAATAVAKWGTNNDLF
eukprot:TRINITY_DN4678_c0_g2_i2.p1 TRINITY_DN4678_c0_g2~~TRINITY_DN4678_c0_g2_i2.p1  ORF type:complete len:234 (-),score=42.97 TRINITY_DN4678_c0_g2_i2:172-873(-)